MARIDPNQPFVSKAANVSFGISKLTLTAVQLMASS